MTRDGVFTCLSWRPGSRPRIRAESRAIQFPHIEGFGLARRSGINAKMQGGQRRPQKCSCQSVRLVHAATKVRAGHPTSSCHRTGCNPRSETERRPKPSIGRRCRKSESPANPLQWPAVRAAHSGERPSRPWFPELRFSGDPRWPSPVPHPALAEQDRCRCSASASPPPDEGNASQAGISSEPAQAMGKL